MPKSAPVVAQPGPSSFPKVQNKNDGDDGGHNDDDEHVEQTTDGSEDNADSVDEDDGNEDDDDDDEAFENKLEEKLARMQRYDVYGRDYPENVSTNPNDSDSSDSVCGCCGIRLSQDPGRPLPSAMSAANIDDELYEGAIFSNKDELINKVGSYHSKHRVEYRVPRSSKTQYFVVCKQKGCSFMLRATAIPRKGWRVIEFFAGHFVSKEVTQPTPKRRSEPRRCGICRETGHTRGMLSKTDHW